MPRFVCHLIVLFTSAAFIGCTSLRTIVDANAPLSGSTAVVQPALAPNDSLTVTTRDGIKTQIHLTTAAPDFFDGTQDSDKQPRHFQLSEVVKIERREFDSVKTTFLVIAIAAAVYLIAKAAAEASLASNL